jgi:V/A-type H+-transporting ATPase subunit I
MIVGDGGYGLILLALTLYFRKKMNQSEGGQRIFRLLFTISISTICWGIISCTWFAIDMNKISPDSSFSFLKKLKNFQICDTSNNNFMMLLALYIGVVHLNLAHIVQIIRQWGSTVILANLGWIIGLWGGTLHLHLAHPAGKYLFFLGLGLVFLFSSTSKNIFKHIAEGLLGLLGISQTFADVMSYLRLFALGLAGTVMGSIFNQLGADMQAAVPGIFGYVLMILIVFFGHTLNLAMAVMGGFIHGLRLNFLEFYRYCFEGTGHDYRPMVLHKK